MSACIRLGILLILAARVSQAAAPPMELFATSDAVRVFEDGYAWPDRPAKEIRVFGLRNETVSAQCVVRASEELKKLAVVIGPLRRTAGRGAIGAENVGWRFVTSIFIEKNTRKGNKADLTRPAPARFPDCLSEDRECSLAKGSLKAIYLTIRIPKAAEPGEYRAEVLVTAGPAKASLPLVLTVYPLTLPDERHVMVSEWFSTNQFKRHHGVEPSRLRRR